MKILITGSSGFVGKHLVRRLSRDHKLIKYDLKNGHDVLEEKLLLKKMQGVDLVIHLAAFISASQSWEKPEEYMKNNVMGTLSVVRNSIKSGVKKLIFFSSAAVKAKPLTPYAISKLSAENLLKLYKKDINIIIVRPENIYGLGQKEAYGYVIHNFIAAIKQAKEIFIFGNGKQTRDFIYIDDVVSVVENLTSTDIKSGSIISLGTGMKTSVLDLAKMIMAIINKETEIKYLEKRNEPNSSVANTNTLHKLKIAPPGFIDLPTGIKNLL